MDRVLAIPCPFNICHARVVNNLQCHYMNCSISTTQSAVQTMATETTQTYLNKTRYKLDIYNGNKSELENELKLLVNNKTPYLGLYDCFTRKLTKYK